MSTSASARRFFYAVLWAWDYCNDPKILHLLSSFDNLTDFIPRTAACCIVRTVMNWQNAHADPTCGSPYEQYYGHERSDIAQGSVLPTSFGARKSASSYHPFLVF